MTDLEALYLTEACPTCEAAPSVPCTIRRRHDTRTTHLARQDRAARTLR